MLCEWECLQRGCRCIRCGFPLPRNFGTTPIHKCRKISLRGACPHLGGALGESARVYGCGCYSEKKTGIEVGIFECDLHGRCVIFEKGTHLEDEAIHRCVVCPDNPAKRVESQ